MSVINKNLQNCKLGKKQKKTKKTQKKPQQNIEFT